MTRVEWLTKKHNDLHKQVDYLEQERTSNRSAEHKALLRELKKQKLQIKTELELVVLTQ